MDNCGIIKIIMESTPEWKIGRHLDGWGINGSSYLKIGIGCSLPGIRTVEEF